MSRSSRQRERGIPLTVFTLDESAALELYEQPLVLVRPDGHVAWRGAALPDDPGHCSTVRGGAAVAAGGAPASLVQWSPNGQ